jgi:hypothetical protein
MIMYPGAELLVGTKYRLYMVALLKETVFTKVDAVRLASFGLPHLALGCAVACR